MHKKTALDM